MEVGAVKQAFNNEIILLKKNLNQAKIQTIHKLTRKAKTLTEKKGPEALKEKLKRKAESTVKEVLIMKKIKPRDIARFIVTHTGKLNDYLNKPEVDNNKACARLLLHKSLQEKYKHIRGKFSNISITDLFMSRQERLKLKKEALDKKKNKKKGKDSKTVNVEGEWNVEDSKESIASKSTGKSDDEINNDEANVDEADDDEASGDDANDNETDNDSAVSNESDKEIGNNQGIDDESEDEESGNVIEKQSNDLELNHSSSESEDNDIILSKKTKNNREINKLSIKSPKNNVQINKIKKDKKVKENKNRNLNEKLTKRKFNKESDDLPAKVTKVVDPFFITSSGDNYMSLVEPRQPDEVKESHKQGNRQYRRAVMFGHVPKIKPKKNDFQRNNNFNKQSNTERNKSNSKSEFDKRNFNRKENNVKNEPVPEKLHPSWEAKKKQSGILPFQGKKIVFD